MNILITGASGLIGSVLRTHLGATGRYTISGVDARDLDDDSLASFTLADCYDYDAMSPACRGSRCGCPPSCQCPCPNSMARRVEEQHRVYA